MIAGILIYLCVAIIAIGSDLPVKFAFVDPSLETQSLSLDEHGKVKTAGSDYFDLADKTKNSVFWSRLKHSIAAGAPCVDFCIIPGEVSGDVWWRSVNLFVESSERLDIPYRILFFDVEKSEWCPLQYNKGLKEGGTILIKDWGNIFYVKNESLEKVGNLDQLLTSLESMREIKRGLSLQINIGKNAFGVEKNTSIIELLRYLNSRQSIYYQVHLPMFVQPP